MAHAERLAFHFVPDPQARALALRAGQLDMVADLSPALADELERAGLRVMRSEVGACDALRINIHGRPPHTIGSDPDIRTATGLALDRRTIVAAAWRNSADASHTWIPPRVLGAHESEAVTPIPDVITVAGFNLVGEALYDAVGVDAVRTPWL